MPVTLPSALALADMGIAAGTGALLVLVVVPLVERGARRSGWMAMPTGARWHEGATPHLGGIALGVGIAVGVAVGGGGPAFARPVWMGAGLLFVAGLADDLWGLRPSAKFGAQLGAAALLLAAGLHFWPAGPTGVSALLTTLWVLGLTNALNLLDAMDGIAAGVAALAALSLGVMSAWQGRLPLAVVAATVAAVTAGFLAYNFSPARIFMGDCGSLPLGYLLAALGLGVQQGGTAKIPALVPVAVLAVPLFDTLFVSATRLRRGQSVAKGGTDHTMHRLARQGWSERQVALLFYGAGAVCGGIGGVGAVGPPLLFYGLAAGVGGSALAVGGHLARRTEPGPTGTPDPASSAEERSVEVDERDRGTPTSEGTAP